MTTTNAVDYAAKLSEIVPDLSYAAKFIPQSNSRNAVEKAHSLNWVITLNRGPHSLTTDYMQGIGHVPGRPSCLRMTLFVEENDKHAAETGRGKWYQCDGTDGQEKGFHMLRDRRIPAPSLPDVLHSLVMDSTALGYADFETWAEEYGYDTDSRKAESVYKQCLEIGLKLRAMFGDKKLSELRELFQDY